MEVCPDAGVLIQKLACRIEKDGGAALIADYGHDGTKTDTFRVNLVVTLLFSGSHYRKLLSLVAKANILKKVYPSEMHHNGITVNTINKLVQSRLHLGKELLI